MTQFYINDANTGDPVLIDTQEITGTPKSTTYIKCISSGVASNAMGISSFPFTAQQLLDADVVIFSCLTNNANVMWTGDTPTTTAGHPLTAGTTIVSFDGNAKINNLKFISQTGNSNITITLEKYV